MGKLDGVSAIVTGAARGQGAAHARRFVAEGGCVVLGDVLEDEGTALAAELGERARFVAMDIADEAHWQSAVAAATDMAPLGVLVNNAGIHRKRPLLEETADGFLQILNVNLLGTFLGMRSAAPAMAAGGGGSIVNVASVAARFGFAGMASYSASKGGIVALSRTAAVELGPLGIRVNTILPGAVDTPMMSGNAADARFAALPLGRCATVDDVADIVLFLACADSAYLTGTEVTIDGGSSLAPTRSG